MMIRPLAAAVLFAVTMAASPVALAIHKCTGPDGKVSFQDFPCSGNGKSQELNLGPAADPSSRPAAVPPSAEAHAPASQTEAQRIEAQVAKSQAERRKRELEVVGIPNARRAIDVHLAQCKAEQDALQARKHPASNVWGTPSKDEARASAQREAALGQEMVAAARNCATRTQVLTSELETLRRECSAIGCVPQ